MSLPFSATEKNILLRPAQPQDDPFQFQVYASTRADEMSWVNWAEDQKAAFLQFQFNAQRIHYQSYYPKAEYQVIQCNNIPIGRLIVDRSRDPILLVDIALLPEYRGQGIGTAILKNLFVEADQSRMAMILHVETFNPAMKLYERLGFIKTGEQGIYFEMRRQPKTQ